MDNIIFLILSMVIFYGGTIFFLINCSSLNSYSASQYTLDKKYWLSKTHNWLFLIFTWGYAFPIIVFCHTELMLIGGILIMGVGLAACFRQDDTTNWIHQTLALCGIVLCQLSLCVDYHFTALAANLLFLSVLFYFEKSREPKWMLAIEFLAATTVYVTLILNSL